MANRGMLVALACLAALCVAEAQSVTMVRPGRAHCLALPWPLSAVLLKCCRHSNICDTLIPCCAGRVGPIACHDAFENNPAWPVAQVPGLPVSGKMYVQSFTSQLHRRRGRHHPGRWRAPPAGGRPRP